MTVKNVKGSVLLQSSLEMRLHFVKGSTMFFNDALSAKKAISSILFKFKDRWTILRSAKSSDDATLWSNNIESDNIEGDDASKKGALANAFFYFFTFGNQLPCVINSQTGGYRIIAGTIGVIAPDIAV